MPDMRLGHRSCILLVILALMTSFAVSLQAFPFAHRQRLNHGEAAQGSGTAVPAPITVNFAVYQKPDPKIIMGLRKNNFAVFLDGFRREITGFSTPDRPVTVVLLAEYSRWWSLTGEMSRPPLTPAAYNLIVPAGALISRLINPPNDYASFVVFDMRPTPITDFTNDPKRLEQALEVISRYQPVMFESKLFDGLRFVLLGGRSDPPVLDQSKERWKEYGGLPNVMGRRKAVFLISSGIDTFSKLSYSQASKIIQNAGVPIFVVGTGGMYRAQLGKGLTDTENAQLKEGETRLKALARETGGAFEPCNDESELPGIFEKLSAMVRGQYSLTFQADEIRDGKAHQIVVKVDADGDGAYDESSFVVQARQIYNAPKAK